MNKQQQKQIEGRRKTKRSGKTTQAAGEEHNNCVIYSPLNHCRHSIIKHEKLNLSWRAQPPH